MTRFEQKCRDGAARVRKNFSTFIRLEGVHLIPCVVNEDPQGMVIAEGGRIDPESKEIEVAKADVASAGVEESAFTVAASVDIGTVEGGAFQATTEDLEVLDGIEGLDNPSSPVIRFFIGDDAGQDED